MPIVKNEIKHELGQSLAILRLKDSCEWAHSFSDLKETWSANIMEFTASVQGLKISGNVEVTDDLLIVAGKVPLIALPFKSWIPNIFQNALKPRNIKIETASTSSDTPLIFYLHIPKAGGTTLGDFIYNQCRNEMVDDSGGLIRNGVFFMTDGFFRENESAFLPQLQNILSRTDLRAVIGHFAFGIHHHTERPFTYITILREPVSRIISLYHYLKLGDKMSLEEFATTAPYREVDNDQTRRIAGVNPETGKCSEKDLEKAKENLRNHFSVVGITERFDETLALLKQKFNWTQNISAYPKNVNTDKKTSGPYPETTIRAIEQRNLHDIELYQYCNQLLDEMIAAQGETFSMALKREKELNSF